MDHETRVNADSETRALALIGDLVDSVEGLEEVYDRLEAGDEGEDLAPLLILSKIRDTVRWGLGLTPDMEFLAQQLRDLKLAIDLLGDEL